ncbi:hypothetical protein [Nocardia sp. NBC_00416]|uniref:hypothetical protein n=1 Tax=Nocardia sp. NBC_00416 TaxID=2975991 RepID=UPI002E1C3DF9
MTAPSGPPGNARPIDPRTEVERVHSLLAIWLGSAASPQVLDAFAAAHHDDFSMVTVAGTVARKSELVSGLHRARNSRPGLVIETSDIETLFTTADTAVVRFVENQHDGNDPEYRRTTAVLLLDPEEHRYRWLTVHETAVTPEEIARTAQ